MLKGFIPCFRVEGAEKLLPLQHCRDALITALAGQIGLARLQTIGKCRIRQKCPCRTAEITETLCQNPFRRFRIMNPIASNHRHRKIFLQSACKRRISPLGNMIGNLLHRRFMPAARYRHTINRPCILCLFAETQRICQLIAALYHLRRRNLYQYWEIPYCRTHCRQNLQWIGHAVFCLIAIYIRSLICQRREKFRKQIPCRCAHLYDIRADFLAQCRRIGKRRLCFG